jgi:hypothetical protein
LKLCLAEFGRNSAQFHALLPSFAMIPAIKRSNI